MPNQPNHSITVLGAGSWGTALAQLLASNQHSVTLWSHNPKHIEEMRCSQVNQKYLPGVQLHKNICFESDLKRACESQDNILLVVPSHAVEALLQKLQSLVKPQGLCWAIKGLEPQTEQLLSERVQHYFPKIHLAMLAGPSFAKEVVQSLPTAVSIATDQLTYGEHWADLFRNDWFRVYCNEDLIAAQLAGAMKNVLAIACGIADGLGYGANTRAAVITRGLAEMIRLGLSMGAQEHSFSGLAGIGDLVLTCTDNLSRNRRFGLLLGQGKNIKQATQEIGQVVEGLFNAKQVIALAKKHQVELPICQEVAAIVSEAKSAQEAVEELLRRSPNQE